MTKKYLKITLLMKPPCKAIIGDEFDTAFAILHNTIQQLIYILHKNGCSSLNLEIEGILYT